MFLSGVDCMVGVYHWDTSETPSERIVRWWFRRIDDLQSNFWGSGYGMLMLDNSDVKSRWQWMN